MSDPAPPRGSILCSVTPDLPAAAVSRFEPAPEVEDYGHAAVRDRYDALHHDYQHALGSDAPAYCVVDAGSGTELVVLDATLWEQLFDVYAYHGWDGVRAVENALRTLMRSAPVQQPRWALGWKFFLAVRRLLAGQIAFHLQQLEFAVGTQVAIQLPETGKVVQATIDRYEATETVTRRLIGKETEVAEKRHYTFGAATETQALVGALRTAVQHRATYEATLQRVADVRAGIQYLRRTVRRTQVYDRPGQLADLDVAAERAALLEEQQTKLYRSMQENVSQEAPLALLALEGLRPGFETDELIQLLGSILFALRSRVDELAAAVDTSRSRVSETLTDGALDTPAPPRGRSAPGPERLVIDTALAHITKQPGWMPIVHEQTLHALIETGAVARDSFTYIVWARYVLALTRVLDERRAEDEAWRDFWSAFAKGASALSLALLVTPAAKISPVVRGLAVGADLVLLAHTVSSVTGQLAQLDQLANQQVLGSDAFSVEGLGRLGELGAFHRELVDGITQQLMVEILLAVAGARWPAVKRLLMTRGVYNDLQTVLAD